MQIVPGEVGHLLDLSRRVGLDPLYQMLPRPRLLLVPHLLASLTWKELIPMIPSKVTSQLLTAAPPYARRIGLRCWLRNKLIEWRGRGDARLPADPDGFLPTTLALHRQADQVAGQIDDALRAQLESLDREIANLSGEQHRLRGALAEAQRARTSLSDTEHSEGSLAADETSRAIRVLSERIDALTGQINAAEAKVGNLAQRRTHLHAAARDIADTWSSRCDELAAHHRRGFLRGKTEDDGGGIGVILPRHTSKYEWAQGGTVPVSITLDQRFQSAPTDARS